MNPFLIVAALSWTPMDIEHRIYELQPHVEPAFAHELAQEVWYWAYWYQADPMLTLALAMEESSLNPKAVSVTGDTTVFQFSPGSIKAYKLNPLRLKKDLGYQVMCHFMILQDKMATCRGPHGWSCYHSITPKLRKVYEHRVLRYLPKAA